MDQNQSDKTLYIDKFKEQVVLLCKPYEHPKYLELLGLKENNLQKKFKDALSNTINKAQPSSNSNQFTIESFTGLKTRLCEKFNEILPKDDLNEDLLPKEELKNIIISILPKVEAHSKEIFTAFLETYSPHEDLIKDIKTLREELTNYIKNYREETVHIIQAFIRRESVQAQENATTGKQGQAQNQLFTYTPLAPNENRHIILDDIIKDLWTSFSKSLLEGEFLKDSDYSIKLQDIISEIKHTYDTSPQEESIYLHPILPYIHELCQELSYMCLRIRVQIEEPQEEASSKRKVFHAPVSDLARKLYAGGMNSEEMLKAKLFHDLGKKLIEMTRIDISGIIDDQAIPPLLLLYKQCERLKAENDAMCRDFPTDLYIKAIFKAICAKTSLLLFQSFYKPVVESDNSRKLNKDESIKNPYTRAKNFEILYEGNRYYVEKEGEKKENLLYYKINEFESLTPFEESSPDNSTDNSTDKPTDRQNYNDYVTEKNKKEKGKEIWKDVLQNEEEQKKILESLLKDPKNIKTEHLIYFRSLDLLLVLMKRLKKMKEEEKNNYNTSKYAQALGYLLKCFSEWIQSYEDFVSAEQKRNKFEDSFYVVMEVELKIFISSYGCKLIHTPALQGEVYPKYNRLYRQWISEAQDEAMDRANKASDEASQKMQKEVSQVQNIAEVKINTEINKAQADSRRESISTLSIFVALLSFISGGINILQGAAGLADYLILTATLYIFIASIIFFLYFKTIEGDKQEKELNWSKIVMLIATAIAIRVVVVGLCIKYYNKTEAQDSKGGLEMNVKVENFNQTSPNVKQITNSSSDSSKTSDVIKGDQGKKKTENASKEQQKKQGKS